MKKKNNKFMRLPAFSLTELLVVLVIIGILVLLALPNLMPLITKAKSTEAKIQLGHLHTLEQSYYYEHSRYSDDLQDIGFQQEKLVTQEGKANYRIEIMKASVSSFKARATAVVDFDKDGIYNVWEVDENKNIKEVVKD